LQVQADIIDSLALKSPLHLVASFDRPNIHFSVMPLLEAENPIPIVAKTLKEGGFPCSIIYVLKRETADDVARKLKKLGEIHACVLSPPRPQHTHTHHHQSTNGLH
jgi:ATP-dependent DNA helicase RecQ